MPRSRPVSRLYAVGQVGRGTALSARSAWTLALRVGASFIHTHRYRAPCRLTWQSTIILSLGSSSPAPGRGPGLAEAARLGPRAAQRGVRLRSSWRGLRSPPGPELRGLRQCRSHCLRLASPRSWPLGPRCSVPPELRELGTGGRRQRGPAPAPPSSPAGARGGPRCASSGTRSASFPAGRRRLDLGCRPGVHGPARARDPA